MPRKERWVSAFSMFHSHAGSSFHSIRYAQSMNRPGRNPLKAFRAESRPAVPVLPASKGECLIPIDKGISRFNIRLTLDEVSRPFFCGVLSVQRIGFRVFPCPDECVEEDGTVPVPSGMPPHPELFAAYAIGNQQFRTGCNPRASFGIVTGTLFIFMAKRCLWEKADMNFPVIAPSMCACG